MCKPRTYEGRWSHDKKIEKLRKLLRRGISDRSRKTTPKKSIVAREHDNKLRWSSARLAREENGRRLSSRLFASATPNPSGLQKEGKDGLRRKAGGEIQKSRRSAVGRERGAER